ncbi:MAG TPA: UDP-N-acetylmuramoyl-L-alanyl-D-glutamate--2,6-diaminopimelate ligase [Candidatus Polarisedimenticolia bacterium]|jgi:UDP-N-acetylmuramoyl-L-alanyl-D-glutamate--2,6-diaminopimelate ligase
MLIGRLLGGFGHRWLRGGSDPGIGSLEVTGITHDSRQAGPGVLFVAIRGARADGLAFAHEAVARGAAAIVTGPGREGAPELDRLARVIEVEDERAALAVMARELHGRPDEKLRMVGVTGTNGKTTTCRILEEMLVAAGVGCGVLGTVSYRLGGEEIAADRTTPEAPDIHRFLDRMIEAGCGACVMEVSSHSVALKRVHGIGFEVAVFTNLTREHLDYHRDMESYYQAKAALFETLGPQATAVINIDDSWGARLASELGGGGERRQWPKRITFGTSSAATIGIAAMETGASGLRLTLAAPEGRFDLTSPLVGRPNGYNVAAAAAAARAMRIDWDAVTAGAAAVSHVPGRMEKVGDQDFTVIVDYAHKEEALRSLLETVRGITAGRVIVVFGCGGDRDRTKRPLMGAHAARLGDVVFVTSDNPRSEKPEAIIEEIMAGVEEARAGAGKGGTIGEVHVQPDRRKAIEAAIKAARPSDTVVIAGKGHETYQIIGNRVVPFDDRVVALEALGRLGRRTGTDGSA